MNYLMFADDFDSIDVYPMEQPLEVLFEEATIRQKHLEMLGFDEYGHWYAAGKMPTLNVFKVYAPNTLKLNGANAS